MPKTYVMKQAVFITHSVILYTKRYTTTYSFPSIKGLILWNHTRQQWRECLTRQQCLVPEPAIR